MNAMPPLPRKPTGPRSTVCEVQRWVTVTVAEAEEARERYVLIDKRVSADAKNALCEVFRWVSVTVNEALKRGERGRCVECKQPVRPHRGSVDGMAPHFEHEARNPKCSKSDPR